MAKKKKRAQVSARTPKMTFSFEYYDDRISSKYCLSSWTEKQTKEAMSRLKNISTMTFDELRGQKRVYHFGEVDWKKTTEKNGFPDKSLQLLSSFHFALLGVNGQRARVFGAYSTNVFYIVWFDLNHEIWPVTLKHT